jgi:hypothetical protein
MGARHWIGKRSVGELISSDRAMDQARWTRDHLDARNMRCSIHVADQIYKEIISVAVLSTPLEKSNG